LKEHTKTESKFFSYEEENLHYITIGSGPEPLIAFHGFGQDHQLFVRLAEKLSGRFTCYLFDVYYHGSSTRPETPLGKEQWRDTLSAFLSMKKIDRFSILSYSLGGRFGIAGAYEFADRINDLYLIAPDAIVTSIWYRFSTSFWFKRSFKYLMKNPDKFQQLLDFFERYKIVNRTLIQFARKELGPKENRIKVYRCWVYFKDLKYPTQQLVDQFNKQNVKVHLLLGSKDRIITPEEVQEKWHDVQTIDYKIIAAKHHELVYQKNLHLFFGVD
jgi:pimeloyl-ACP methyl ester carboxylesterase